MFTDPIEAAAHSITRMQKRIEELEKVALSAKSAYLEKGGPATFLEEELYRALVEAGFLPVGRDDCD